jgi:hypothetical protein
MRKSRFTESQIVGIQREIEGGRKVVDVCREYAISQATYYKWKSKYGGMEVADIRHPFSHLCMCTDNLSGPENQRDSRLVQTSSKSRPSRCRGLTVAPQLVPIRWLSHALQRA